MSDKTREDPRSRSSRFLEATTESKKTLPIPPLVGRVSLAAGVVLLVTNARRKGA
jgi:hypothetical protein